MGDWWEQAECRKEPQEWFFAIPGEDGYTRTRKLAKDVCLRCPVRLACLEWAMDIEAGVPREFRHGVYGGLGPRERFLLDRGWVAS